MSFPLPMSTRQSASHEIWTYDREIDKKRLEIRQRFQYTLNNPTPCVFETDIVDTSHDEFDLGVHCLVEHLCCFSATEIDIWSE